MNEASDKRRYEKLKALEAQRHLRVENVYRELMKIPDGREFFYHLLEICKIGKNPFTANALTMSFACGELNVGQQIQARLMELTPAHFLKMLEEKREEELSVQRATDGNGSGDDD